MSITDPDMVYGPGEPYHDNINVPGNDGVLNPYPYGECTWYCWQFYHDTQGINLPSGLGDATDWVTSAHREQWIVDNNPVAGKTVCWSYVKYPPVGHVAVVAAVNGDGSFDVLEANFKYFSHDNPKLAGKVDRRTVRDKDGILGFISPTGVTISDNAINNPFDALTVPFNSIGDALSKAALYIQAEAMTAEHKLMSVGQVGVGLLMTGAGGTLMALTLAGHGSPSAGFQNIKRRVRGTAKAVDAIGSPSRAYKDAEAAWISRRAKEELAKNTKLYNEWKNRKPVKVNGLSRSEIARDRAATRRRIEAARSTPVEDIPF